MPDFPGTLKPPRLAAAPGSPVVGQMYYDTVLGSLYYWNGTLWVACSGTGATAEVCLAGGMGTTVVDGARHWWTNAGGAYGPCFGFDPANFGPGKKYTQWRLLGNVHADTMGATTDWTVNVGLGRPYVGTNVDLGNFGDIHFLSGGAGVGVSIDSGWTTIAAPPAGVCVVAFSYLHNSAGGVPAGTYLGLGLWARGGGTVPLTYGTTLPTSPADGQEAILVDSLTNPSYQWRFRYNAGSTSAYKWEFVGGSKASATIITNETTASLFTTYADLATVGPSVTVARAGDYLVGFGASAQNGQVSMGAVMNVRSTSVAELDLNATYLTVAAGNIAGALWKEVVLPGVAAGDAIRCRYCALSGGTAAFGRRQLLVQPVRVS